MANNLVVQLLLKTGTFSTDLKKARGQVQNFQKGCDTAGKSVSAFGKALGVDVGMLTKFGGAVGAAVVAGKAMKAMIDSNQTSADNFAGVMYSAKTAVGEFAYAISTFDFTNFNDGLSGLIQRARDAYAAIDQLGDTLRAYSIKEAKARAAVAHARKVARDANASPEEKKAAAETARQLLKEAAEGAEMAVEDYANTIIAKANQEGARLSKEGALDLIDKALEMNAGKGREKAKEIAQADYQAYLDEVAALNKTWGGTTQTFSTNFGTYSYNNDQYKKNPEYIRQLEEIADRHKESIVYNAILIKQNDEELNQMTHQRTAMYGLNEQLDMLDSRLEGVENKVNGTTGATKKQEEAVEGSLESWTKIAAQAKSMRDSVEFGTEAWKGYNDQLKEAEKNIEKINMLMSKDRYKDLATPIAPANPVNTPLVTDTSKQGLSEKGAKQYEGLSINELKEKIKMYTELAANVKGNAELLAHYNNEIYVLNGMVNNLEKVGVPEASVPQEAIDSWDEFNNTMSNTSTIVSALANTFKEGTELTLSSILAMVSTALPAIGSLIGSIQALSAAEAVEAGVAATAKAVSTSKHWIEAIAAIAALGATVAGALSAAKSQKFAQGGIVGGNSFTGDRMTAQVNSGEMILNKTQQANLFRLANAGATGGQVEFHISGTDLVGVLNNQTRKNNLIR